VAEEPVLDESITVEPLSTVHDRTDWSAGMSFSDAPPDGGGDNPWPGGDLNHTA
jgi:hypothetical protein